MITQLDLADRKSHLLAKRKKVVDDIQDLQQRQRSVTDPDRQISIHFLLAQKHLTVARIDGALARLADGYYGQCPNCQQGIATNRLRRMPEAETCVSCQRG